MLSDRPVTDTEPSEDKVCQSNEIPLRSIPEKLAVSTLAKSLVGIPPGVIELGVVSPGAVKLTETGGTVKLPGKTLDDNEGTSGDILVGSPSEGSETLTVDKVGSTDPILDVPIDDSPERLDRSDVGTATEVGPDMMSDTLKVPVVYTVTVYGVYDVIVTEPSQTGRHQSVIKSLSDKVKDVLEEAPPTGP